MHVRSVLQKEPIKKDGLQAFLNLWDRQFQLPSSSNVSSAEALRFFRESLVPTQDNEIRHELRFYRELPEVQQTSSELRTRMKEICRRRDRKQAREAQERYLREQLNFQMPKSRGQPGKKNDAESS